MTKMNKELKEFETILLSSGYNNNAFDYESLMERYIQYKGLENSMHAVLLSPKNINMSEYINDLYQEKVEKLKIQCNNKLNLQLDDTFIAEFKKKLTMSDES